MASKLYPERNSATPLQILLSDCLLSSKILLPTEPSIAYAKFTPDANVARRPHESIEAARREILERNVSTSLLESLLTSIHIGESSFIYAFLITSESRTLEATSTLDGLHFDGLYASEISAFKLKELYPCSAECSLLPRSCPQCQHSSPLPNPTLGDFGGTPVTLLPRVPLRKLYAHFLEAIRARILSDIAFTAAAKGQRDAKRLKGGFLLGPLQTTNEWGSNWEYRTLTRPLVYCQLHIYLSRSPTEYLIVHPLLTQTPFLPLSNTLPIPAGTPITLLPHATPAYFLNHYTGPTSALIKQFKETLRGMGVDGWDHPPHRAELPSKSTYGRDNHPAQGPAFIIAWITVENKQGEDKGIVAIYPISLCLSFTPNSSYVSSATSRQPLSYIPDLPAALQPSPHISSAPPSTIVSQLHSRTNTPLPSHIPMSPDIPQTQPVPIYRPLPSSLTSDPLRAFRTLTLSKSRGVPLVASEIGGYVDAVARERERERERLKRERENTGASTSASASPRLTRTSTTTPAPTAAAAVLTPALGALTPGNTTNSTAAAANSAITVPGVMAGPSNLNVPPNQNFYPSPPQSNIPSVAAQTSPSNENSTTPGPIIIPPSAGIPETPAPPPNTSYDPFGNIDPTWSQPQPDATWSEPQSTYLGMDMGMDFDDMGFGMNLGMNMSGGRSGPGAYDDGDTNMDFEDAFTDDDFSFFDRPSRTPTSALVAPTIITSGPGLSQLPLEMSSPLFGEMHLSGSDLLHHPPSPQTQPHLSGTWGLGNIGEGFTPRFMDDGPSIVPPDLLPPSPGQTPSSHSAPVTPAVHIEHDSAMIRRPRAGIGGGNGNNIFDPIPFSSYHRVADDKYANGKFALPSPPDEEDRTEPLRLPSKYFPTTSSSATPTPITWRSRYLAVTDPRIGVVRKLKRKVAFEQGGRDLSDNMNMSPTWMREAEEWEKSSVDVEGLGLEEENKSDVESEEDDFADTESPIISRPSTPLPVYLPLGPTLLQTQFQHMYLLPLSTPLRPPGAAVAPVNIITGASLTSVPTPVSPAATMGAASEKSKSLEAAAFTVATEVVENSLWAEAWRASTLGSCASTEAWPTDVGAINKLFEAVASLNGTMNIGNLLGASQVDSVNPPEKPLQAIEAPKILIGKGESIIEVVPTALRFWEKLGLGPKAGKKDGTSFVLFEPGDEQRQQQIENWLSTVVSTYESKRLGSLHPGQSSHCTKEGLVPIRFDSSFRKSLASFIASLPATESSLVFFVVTPFSTMTLASPILRQVFSSIKKALKTYSEARILFQLIPEELIFSSMSNPASNLSDLIVLCSSVYNRILVPVDRSMSRRFFEFGERVRKYFQEPAITLARPHQYKVSYSLEPHATLDVLDRLTFMHVGYQVSPCGKWILAACVDQRGEGHDLGVWLTQTPGEDDSDGDIASEMFLVKKIWDFAAQFAKRADVEWRLVIAKFGTMAEAELNAWATLLDPTVGHRHELPKVHVSLLSVEVDANWIFISTKHKTSNKHKPTTPARASSLSPKHQQHNTFTDISSTIYVLPPRTHLPEFLPASLAGLGLNVSYIPETSSLHNPDSPTEPYPHPLPLLPHSSTTLIQVPASPTTTSISMLHIHLLHVVQPLLLLPSSTPEEILRLHMEITRNFHDLAVLAGVRWNLGTNPLLPFHLAAVDAMRVALDRDRGGMDGCDN